MIRQAVPAPVAVGDLEGHPLLGRLTSSDHAGPGELVGLTSNPRTGAQAAHIHDAQIEDRLSRMSMRLRRLEQDNAHSILLPGSHNAGGTPDGGLSHSTVSLGPSRLSLEEQLDLLEAQLSIVGSNLVNGIVENYLLSRGLTSEVIEFLLHVYHDYHLADDDLDDEGGTGTP